MLYKYYYYITEQYAIMILQYTNIRLVPLNFRPFRRERNYVTGEIAVFEIFAQKRSKMIPTDIDELLRKNDLFLINISYLKILSKKEF